MGAKDRHVASPRPARGGLGSESLAKGGRAKGGEGCWSLCGGVSGWFPRGGGCCNDGARLPGKDAYLVGQGGATGGGAESERP